jgi:hypothetical protein
MLAVAYGVHVLVAALTPPRPPNLARRLLPFLPVVLLAALWLAWRPHPEGFNYQRVMVNIARDLLLTDPLRFLRSCVQVMFGGWIRSFTADSDVHVLAKAAFGLLGLAGVAGSVLRARANRLDGWYVLLSLPLVFAWLFSEDSSRRLQYPLVPILIVHAAVFVAFAMRGIRSPGRRRILSAAAAALPMVLCFPAWLLVQSKSLDREPIHPGLRYRYADMTEYYTTIDVKAARGLASKHAAVLGGLESLRTVTPPGSRVIWLRPAYVATLGERPALPLYEGGSQREFLRQVRLAKADYVVISSLLKASMEGSEEIPEARFNWVFLVSDVAYAVRSLVTDGYEVAVLKIDPAAVARLLDAGADGGKSP